MLGMWNQTLGSANDYLSWVIELAQKEGETSVGGGWWVLDWANPDKATLFPIWDGSHPCATAIETDIEAILWHPMTQRHGT